MREEQVWLNVLIVQEGNMNEHLMEEAEEEKIKAAKSNNKEK